MSEDNPDPDFFTDLARDTAENVIENSRRTVNYLRLGATTAIDRKFGENILAALEKVDLTNAQLDNLENAFIKSHRQVISRIFALLYGDAKLPGWPDNIQLINGDTGEILHSDAELEWLFVHELNELIKSNRRNKEQNK